MSPDLRTSLQEVHDLIRLGNAENMKAASFETDDKNEQSIQLSEAREERNKAFNKASDLLRDMMAEESAS